VREPDIGQKKSRLAGGSSDPIQKVWRQALTAEHAPRANTASLRDFSPRKLLAVLKSRL